MIRSWSVVKRRMKGWPTRHLLGGWDELHHWHDVHLRWRRESGVQKSGVKLYWYGTNPARYRKPIAKPNNEYCSSDGSRIARRDSSSNVDYYFADHLGTARVVTDAGGTVQDDIEFYPYGRRVPYRLFHQRQHLSVHRQRTRLRIRPRQLRRTLQFVAVRQVYVAGPEWACSRCKSHGPSSSESLQLCRE